MNSKVLDLVFDGVCSNVSAMECGMQAGALSIIMLMNIYIKIRKGIKIFGKQIVNSFVYKAKSLQFIDIINRLKCCDI